MNLRLWRSSHRDRERERANGTAQEFSCLLCFPGTTICRTQTNPQETSSERGTRAEQMSPSRATFLMGETSQKAIEKPALRLRSVCFLPCNALPSGLFAA